MRAAPQLCLFTRTQYTYKVFKIGIKDERDGTEWLSEHYTFLQVLGVLNMWGTSCFSQGMHMGKLLTFVPSGRGSMFVSFKISYNAAVTSCNCSNFVCSINEHLFRDVWVAPCDGTHVRLLVHCWPKTSMCICLSTKYYSYPRIWFLHFLPYRTLVSIKEVNSRICVFKPMHVCTR